jgi:DNA-binding NtrC family response regulator
MVEMRSETVVATGLASQALRGRTAVRAVRCQGITSAGATSETTVGARPITVGGDHACDLRVDDPTVSRRHVELQILGEGVRVKDLGSTNGTFSGTNRISEATFRPGATLKIGDATLRLLAIDAPHVIPSQRRSFGGLVGSSAAMREVFAILELAAPSDASVLIEGESGTGKELAARALHDFSARAPRPFVVLDCAAVGGALIDSHCFGHVRGAFTGADHNRDGAFVRARGGTVFLDEIGELPLESQVKLLRVLEDHTVQPVGSDERVPVDVRLVAATNRDLVAEVGGGRFRHDLFHRLSVIHMLIPPLRERADDLIELVEHFYRDRDVVCGPVAGDNLSRLYAHDWPGNVRELRNVLERAFVLGGGAQPFAALNLSLTACADPNKGGGLVVDTTRPFKDIKEKLVDEIERRYAQEVFAQCEGNISRAADHAGLSRKHFRELLVKHQLIERPADGADPSDDEHTV